jgi:hypothetical protein
MIGLRTITSIVRYTVVYITLYFPMNITNVRFSVRLSFLENIYEYSKCQVRYCTLHGTVRYGNVPRRIARCTVRRSYGTGMVISHTHLDEICQHVGIE